MARMQWGSIDRCAVGLAVLAMGCLTAYGDEAAVVSTEAGEQLSYTVSWSGIRCGAMEITRFDEVEGDGAVRQRIVVLMRTSKFFDGIYRVRSRLDSTFDPVRMSSTSYEERSQEKKKHKEDLWVVDRSSGVVTRTKNGEVKTIPLEVEGGYDPLAFIFRLRGVLPKVGEEMALGLMTSKGVVETVSRVTKRKTLSTKAGKIDAVAIVPEPRDKMMFSKSGKMVVWVERSAPHRLCRIEFDLSFGKLVAVLKAYETIDGKREIPDWRTWGD